MYSGYVINPKTGDIALQMQDSSFRHGFYLYDGQKRYDGGHGIGWTEWKPIDCDSVPDVEKRRFARVLIK